MSIEHARQAYADRDRFAALLLGLLERSQTLEAELDALPPASSSSSGEPDERDRLAAHLLLGALVLGRRLQDMVPTNADTPDTSSRSLEGEVAKLGESLLR